MSPETVTAASVVVVALVTAGPSYLALRRARGAAEAEGENTRNAVSDAITTAVARIEGRLDAVRDELRTDVRELRDWQTSHTAEHILHDHNRRHPPAN
ncbi:hypothetical protein [Streptomyces sp. NBC_01768]|uniref:hypothetical protein n=1 Tax=Streptomyces sp. NBC_01768 TaxID=2975938 RepID=UPI002DDBA444|nr:hypothetical protein [Streptomyces sp. NBC_01768]WSC31798.1 hypothetical protein OG902_36695 [Streptomyces sp. NBC_01768]